MSQTMLTVADVVREYLCAKTAQQQAGLLSKEAVIKNHFYCVAFERDFGGRPVSQCRRGDVKRFLTLHPEWSSPHTQHAAARQIVSCFRWAAEDGLIAVCPYSKPRDLPACEPRQPITRDEVRLILAAAHGRGRRLSRSRFRLATWFLWETGCRTAELFRLDWSQWDPERGVFEMRGKTTRKTGKTRLIVLPRRAWRLIRFLRRWDHRQEGAVFLNGRSCPWNKNTFGKLFRANANCAGVRKAATAYCLRHGFCVEALEAGAGERQLADYMGHASTDMIAWYGRGIRTRVDYLRATVEKRRKAD